MSGSGIRGLSSLGVETPEELLLLVPRGISDYRLQATIREESEFCGPVTVLSYPQKHEERSMWSFDVEPEEGPRLRASFFGSHPSRTKEWKDIRIGLSLCIKGMVRQFGRHFYLSNAQRVPDEHLGRIMPVYRAVPRVITSERLREEITNLLNDPVARSKAVDLLHERLGEASPGHEGIKKILRSLHWPRSETDLEHAIREARRLSVQSILCRTRYEPEINPQSAIPIDWWAAQMAKQSLPFALSPSQDEAVDAILVGLERDSPLSALVSGDVGSGKTVTYGLPAVAAWKAGARVAVLAPNTPLARQIATELRGTFPEAQVSLVTSDGVDGNANQGILVGTTAILGHARKRDWKADLLIVDEQQKFGLEQKKALTHEATNILESTATCIPHTLGRIQHGGMPIFRLKGHAKKTLTTQVVGQENKTMLTRQLRQTIENGYRAVIIYPQVSTGEDDFRRNVLAAAERWEEILPGQIVLLHGKMKDREKVAALELARSGEKPVLVSTSIMEVGITIPKLRLGIVVSADRYGLSTLHQMRGRLARDGGEGMFYPYVSFPLNAPLTPEKQSIVERLKLLEKTQDGFELAEMDAQRRGFGDILNDQGQQHGKTMTAFIGLTLTPDDFSQEIEK